MFPTYFEGQNYGTRGSCGDHNVVIPLHFHCNSSLLLKLLKIRKFFKNFNKDDSFYKNI